MSFLKQCQNVSYYFQSFDSGLALQAKFLFSRRSHLSGKVHSRHYIDLFWSFLHQGHWAGIQSCLSPIHRHTGQFIEIEPWLQGIFGAYKKQIKLSNYKKVTITAFTFELWLLIWSLAYWLFCIGQVTHSVLSHPYLIHWRVCFLYVEETWVSYWAKKSGRIGKHWKTCRNTLDHGFSYIHLGSS